MKKRILAAVLIIVLSIPGISVLGYAEASVSYERDIEFLNSLTGSLVSIEKEDELVTKREAVLLALKLCVKDVSPLGYRGEFSDIKSDDEDAPYLAYALNSGIIARLNTGRFAPDSKLSYIDALKMIFNSLGYGQIIRDSKKGDSAYHRLAAEYDMTIKAKNSYALTVGELSHLVAIALDTPILQETGLWGNGDFIYNNPSNVTPLTKYYDIEKLQGRVSQNNKSSLFDKAGLGYNGIVINGVQLACGEEIDTDALLGRELTVYYHTDKNELRYYELTGDDESVILNSDNIDSYVSNKYYYTENNKQNTYPLSVAPAIIYNGVAITADEASYIESGEIFVPSNGMVELIRAKDAGYSCVKITNYETYIAQGVDIDGKRIVDKYNKPVLELDGVKNLSLKNTIGEDVDFDYIGSMNVLSVAMSLDGSAADVIVCNDAVQGILASFDEDEIQIEVEGFVISDRMKEIISVNPLPSLGEDVIVYLDARGKAALAELSPNDGWSFGYIIEKGETSGLSKKYMVKMLTADNKVEKLDLYKNIRIDGTSYRGAVDSAASVVPVETPVKYRLNVKGEVRELDTPTVGANEGINSLKPSYSSDSVRWVDYISSFSGHTFIKSGSVTFTVPETPTGDERDYVASKVESSFVKDVDYKIATYMENSLELVDTLVVKKSNVSRGVSGSDVITVVDRVVKSLDDEGNEVAKIYGINGGIMRSYIVTDKTIYSHETDGDPLERGDLVRINANSRSEVMALQRCFDNDLRTMHTQLGGANPSVDNLDVIFRLSYGKVLNLRNNLIQVKLDNLSDTIEKYYINGTVVVVDKKEIRAGSLADIVSDTSELASSKVVVEMRYMRIRTIVVYKDV